MQGWDPWDLAIVRESIEEYRRLAEEEGGEPVRRNGGLRVARTEEGARWLDRVRRVLEQEGTEARQLGAGEMRELLPFADLADVRAGLYTPDDSTLSSTALKEAYLRAAGRQGAQFRQEAATATAEPLPARGWRIGEEPAVVADALVVAAGAWSKEILARLGRPLPLAPFRAQALCLRPRPLLASFPTLHDLDLNMYLRPASLGRVLAGDGTGSREENPSGWDPNADGPFVEQMVGAASDLLSGLGSIKVESAWAGLCVASPDRFPLVGRVPGKTISTFPPASTGSARCGPRGSPEGSRTPSGRTGGRRSGRPTRRGSRRPHRRSTPVPSSRSKATRRKPGRLETRPLRSLERRQSPVEGRVTFATES